MLIIFLLLAQSGLIPSVDDSLTIGTHNARFSFIHATRLRVGNPNNTHDNVLGKFGSGETSRPDMLVGIGSGFSSIYTVHIAPSYKWIGNGNSSITALYVGSVSLNADGNSRIADPFYLINIDMNAFIDPNLSIPVLGGLRINYALPNNVNSAYALDIRNGGPAYFSGSIFNSGNFLELSSDQFFNGRVSMSITGTKELTFDGKVRADEFIVTGSQGINLTCLNGIKHIKVQAGIVIELVCL